jgi:FkbM family methyltransferase
MLIPQSIRNLGFFHYCRYRLVLRGHPSKSGPLQLTARNAQTPIRVRPGSSDFSVFRQIFVEEEYAPLMSINSGGLIVDCGANIGCSSIYFLTRFPGCRVIAIEPDPGNFEVLSHNLAPYGKRVQLLHAAVWGSKTELRLAAEGQGRGAEWGRNVEEYQSDVELSTGDHVAAVTIESLLSETSEERIALLKIDIEGAETSLFGPKSQCQNWLRRVDQIAIELHDTRTGGEASRLFLAALGSEEWAFTKSGELTLARRIQRR